MVLRCYRKLHSSLIISGRLRFVASDEDHLFAHHLSLSVGLGHGASGPLPVRLKLNVPEVEKGNETAKTSKLINLNVITSLRYKIHLPVQLLRWTR